MVLYFSVHSAFLVFNSSFPLCLSLKGAHNAFIKQFKEQELQYLKLILFKVKLSRWKKNM